METVKNEDSKSLMGEALAKRVYATTISHCLDVKNAMELFTTGIIDGHQLVLRVIDANENYGSSVKLLIGDSSLEDSFNAFKKSR